MLLLVFALSAAASLASSAVLVSRLERVAERLGVSEAILGLLAALAADAPEITSAAAAIASGQAAVGVGVTLGSNVFNLAALLGLGTLVAGRIVLGRRVVAFSGAIGLLLAVVCLLVVMVGMPAWLGLAAVVVAFLPYLWVSAIPKSRRPRLLRGAALSWFASAVSDEEAEIEEAVHPEPGDATDAVVALAAVVAVVLASLVMEISATTMGTSLGVPDLVVGGLVLAAVTSLPNAVAAVHLASHGRGEATLSVALNSNAINVVVGFLVPATIAGLRGFSGGEELVVVWYLALTAVSLGLAWSARGLGRPAAAVIIGGYLAFVVAVAL